MERGRFIATCAVLALVVPAVSVAQMMANPQATATAAGKNAPEATKATAQPQGRVLYRNQPLRALPPPPPASPLAPSAAAIPPPKPPPKRGKRAKLHRIAITFPGTAAVPPPDAADAVHGFVGATPAPGARFLIRAAAPGVAGDPSVARRLSLRRGLAVRDILRQSGIPTDRIIVQALGNPPGVPTDRVTLTEIP